MVKKLTDKYMADHEAIIRQTKINLKTGRKSAEQKFRRFQKEMALYGKKNHPVTRKQKSACAFLSAFFTAAGDARIQSLTKLSQQIAQLDIAYAQQLHKRDSFLKYLLQDDVSLMLGIEELYQRFLNIKPTNTLKQEILNLVQTDAEAEYTEALTMDRRFILHIGGTNTGKTYDSIERLKQAEQGVYAGPLRLLALEIYDKLQDAGVPCSMITGEEQFLDPDSHVIAATAEMVELDRAYDIAVIDEAQMLGDPDRGHVWSRLLMGIKAPEIHVCAAPEAEGIILRILKQCEADYEIIRHEREGRLVFEDEPYNMEEDMRRGDALIVFSKRSVLDVAARVEMLGKKPSVIYGSLPPQIRKRQVELFTRGKTDIVVATDAIGLGVNLPIRRIIFMQSMKFDGISRRFLTGSEVRQIAGRAGRRGMYETGYIAAVNQQDLIRLKYAYDRPSKIEYARIGFPKVLMDLDEPLDQILREWHKIKPTLDVYRKIDISELLRKYKALDGIKDQIQDFNNKAVLFSLISCSFDLKNDQCRALWLEYCKTYNADVSVRFPSLSRVRGDTMLERAETHYKMLDLYHQISIRFGKVMDEARLYRERLSTEELIMSELRKSKRSHMQRCRYCGKVLPVGYPFTVCEECYDESLVVG